MFDGHGILRPKLAVTEFDFLELHVLQNTI